MAIYGRELWIGTDIRRKSKVENAMEFIERMRRVQEKAGAALRKVQEEMRRQANKGRREVEEQRKGENVMLSTKDLVFKERPAKKLTERYIGLYEIEKVVSKNVVKLKLPVLMRIYPMVSVSRVVRCREPVKGQRVEGLKPIEVEEVEE